MGHSEVKAIVPIVLLGIATASWALRPASRMLGAATPERQVSARIDAHEVTTAAA